MKPRIEVAMKITEALLAEHVVFHNLFDHIERTLPRLKTLPEIRSLARLLEALLESHARAEDHLIIEPLEHCFEQLGQRDRSLLTASSVFVLFVPSCSSW